MSGELSVKRMSDRTADHSALGAFFDEQEQGQRGSMYAFPETYAIVSGGEAATDPRAPYQGETIEGVAVIAKRGEGAQVEAAMADARVAGSHEVGTERQHEVAEAIGDLALNLESKWREQAGGGLDPSRVEEVFSEVGRLTGLEGYENDDQPARLPEN